MDEVARLLTLLALAGGALTLLGAVFAYFLDETRRIKRTLTAALGDEPQPMLVARGRGVGIGFNLGAGLVTITWDKGGWQLTYRIDELVGVELIVDRQVAARAFRGEARRPLDQLAEPQERVRLRFVFDDTAHPDFEMDLWRPEDGGLRGRMEPEAALAEANRWMSRTEALLRRPAAPRAATPTPPQHAPAPAPLPAFRTPAAQTVAGPLFDAEEDDDFLNDEIEDDPRRAIT